jgi:hypothetical protein
MRNVTTDNGEEMVMLSIAEYQDLVDMSDSARVMREFAHGRTEFLDDHELDDYLASPTPLAYWRKRRGVSAADLANAARISADELASLESGRLVGDVATYGRLARRLRTSLDSVVPVERERGADTAAAAE